MWRVLEQDGETVVEGAIGDPLTLRVEGTIPPDANGDPYDFTTGHTWLCQVRRRVPGIIVATLELVADDTSIDPDTNECLIDLTFGLDNTTVFADGTRYVYGVKAVEGDLAPFTLVAARPIYGYDVVPRVE